MLLADSVFVAGLLAIVYGCFLVSTSLACIVGGGLLIVFGLALGHRDYSQKP